MDPDRHDGDTVYEIVESRPLPVVDMSRSVRSTWIHRWLAKNWGLFMRRFHAPLLLGVYISLVLDFLGMFLKAKPGRWCALMALILGTPGCIVLLTLLRSDVVDLLHRTYEYWFFTVANFLSVLLLGMYLGDSQAGLLPGMWIGFQSCILVDADVATASMLIFALVLVSFTFYELIDEASQFVIFRVNERALSVEVALVNTWATVMIVLVRNLYRRHAVMKSEGSNSNTVHCISYRCKIKLVPAQIHNSSPDSERAPSSRASTTLTQLKLVEAQEQFDAANVVFPMAQRLLAQRIHVSLGTQVVMLALAVSGLAASMGSFGFPTTGLRAQTTSFVCTLLVFAISVSLMQRQMLRRLVYSFDFAFLSIQLTLAHVAVCDLLSWDGRCLVVAACWMWMHLVLGIDALTPVTRREWRFCVQFAAPVVLIFILAQLAMASVLAFGVEYGIHDRVVYRAVVRRRKIAIKIASFVLSRIITLLGWSFRMLWRIWTQQGDELILLHGSVFYGSKLSQVRLQKIANCKRSEFTRTSVVPIPQALAAVGPPDLTK